MTSLAIMVTSQEELGAMTEKYASSETKDRIHLNALADYFQRLAGGGASGVVKVATSATSPVQATGTLTCASVIATDAVTIAGETLTFTSSPATEDDVEVDVPTAKAFASATDISVDTGLITESAHGYQTGDVGQLTTSSALPAGFALSTNYYVIKISAGTYKLASSYANALAGIPIIPTTTGTGNQTFTLTVDTYVARSLMNAINAHSVLSKLMKATNAGAVVTMTLNQAGAIGNFVPFSSADATITASGSGFFTSGAGGSESAVVTFTR